MINEHRRKQLLDLMVERGWDSILLYGNAWRKDPFRSLVNFNFSGDARTRAIVAIGRGHCNVQRPMGRRKCLRQTGA